MKKLFEESMFGISTFITVVFAAKKIAGEIDWSWWYVLSPMILFLGLLLFMILIAIVFYIIKSIQE